MLLPQVASVTVARVALDKRRKLVLGRGGIEACFVGVYAAGARDLQKKSGILRNEIAGC